MTKQMNYKQQEITADLCAGKGSLPRPYSANNLNEQGRSLAEMLGVLAIIGSLSIGGMSAYSYGMNKHRANTIINSVSKMAIAASQQIELTGRIGLARLQFLFLIVFVSFFQFPFSFRLKKFHLWLIP